MMSHIKSLVSKKVRSQRGETIAETLVSLLIASIALVMLAGAVSAASAIVTRSSNRLNKYYDTNEAENGVVQMKNGGKEASVQIKSGSDVLVDNLKVYFFENNELPQNKVIAYRK